MPAGVRYLVLRHAGLFFCIWLFYGQAELVHARAPYCIHRGHNRLIGRILVGVDNDMRIFFIPHRFFDGELECLELVVTQAAIVHEVATKTVYADLNDECLLFRMFASCLGQVNLDFGTLVKSG